MVHANQWVSDEEAEKLIRALEQSGKPFSDADTRKVIEWASIIRMGAALLACALDEQGSVKIDERGDVCVVLWLDSTPENA